MQHNFHQGERLRIRIIGPQGQLADPPFWFTVPDHTMSVEDVALQFAQTIQPGMFVSIKTGSMAWTFQKETQAGHNAVRRTHKLPTARYREARMEARRPRRSAPGHYPVDPDDLRRAISMYTPAQVYINGRYQVTGTITPSHGIEDEARTVLGITPIGGTIEVVQGENVWSFTRTEDGISKAIHRFKTAEVRAPRVVNDFNTLDDLVSHAARDLGATHISGADAHSKIYFPRGGQFPYEEATVWRKSGYWHAQGPGARTGVARLPAGARPIGGVGRRAAEARRRKEPPEMPVAPGGNAAPPGPASGFGRETTADDYRARIEWETWAADNQRRLGHEALAHAHDLTRAAYEDQLRKETHGPSDRVMSIARHLAKKVGGSEPKEVQNDRGSRERSVSFFVYSPEHQQPIIVVLSPEKGAVALDVYSDEDMRERYQNISTFLYGPGGYTSKRVDVDDMVETIEWVKKTVDGYAQSRQDDINYTDETRSKVRDYEAVDNRDRRIAGPFKNYGDAKQAAGTGGHVKYVRPRASEARRKHGGWWIHWNNNRSENGPFESKSAAQHFADYWNAQGAGTYKIDQVAGKDERVRPIPPRVETEARTTGAETAGSEYAAEQLNSVEFDDWVYSMLVEAHETEKREPGSTLPLKTPDDARKIARNVLQDLERDVKRQRESPGTADSPAFWKGFHKTLMDSVPGLADTLLGMEREISGAAESRPPKAGRSARPARR